MAGKDVDNYIEELSGFVDNIIKKIPYGRLSVWKDMLFEPSKTIKSEMKNVSLSRGAKDIAVSSFFYSIVLVLLLGIFMGIFLGIMLIPVTLTGGINACILSIVIAVLIVIAIIIFMVLFCIFSWLVYSGIEFLLARLLGGTGEYAANAYIEALQSAAFLVMMTPFVAVSMIPCLSLFTQPVMIALAMYNLYVRYLIIKYVHNLTRNKAIAVVLIPVLVVTALVIAFYVLYFGVIIAASLVKGK